MTDWASPEDVQARWVGPDAPDDTPRLTTLIGDAQRLIIAEYPTMQDRIDTADIDPELVKQVVCGMVARVFRNPEGLRTGMEQDGPFSRQVTYGGDEPGSLHLSDDDRALLVGRPRGRAFTIDPAPNAGADLFDDCQSLTW